MEKQFKEIKLNNVGVTNKVFQHYTLNSEGLEVFAGNFIYGKDTSDIDNKLNGTTSIINFIYPFGNMINPVVEPWLNKQDRREKAYGVAEVDMFSIFDEESRFEVAAKGIPALRNISKELLDMTINDGNYAEVVTLHLLQNGGNIVGLEETVEREKLENKSTLFKSERAIELGTLAYKEIMKLGKQVELVDYQVVASEPALNDVGFFDFVFKVDGKLVLADMKTGSRVKDSKLDKVRYQLLGSYKYKFYGIYGKYPDRVVVISGTEDEVKVVGSKKVWQRFGETLDITNDDYKGDYRRTYVQLATLYQDLLSSNILKRNKINNQITI